ncbi:MAG TPA: peptidylprolyl isomerase [Bacteroidales bacterium]|nr:peptidylprolyl isomerase [Bacteroidales bacterium]HNR41297.1 peptidylprolyl isomerase [Bacteroidales bacterium]HPM87483.1 peptidylprolyl isomerase [Bacteroidales bacterium]
MNMRIKQVFNTILLLLLISCKAPGDAEGSYVLIKTTLGDIKVMLYDQTPLHKSNFIKLVNSGFYDDISFHRVIKDFMIQTGDPNTRKDRGKTLPDSLQSYTLPAEFNPALYHKKGALAAARQGNNVNPSMRSSGTQFYIVQGTRLNEQELNAAEIMINNQIRQSYFLKFLHEISDSVNKTGISLSDSELQEKVSEKMFSYLNSKGDYKFTDEQRNVYSTIGGVPRLDGTYTVFGEVVEGLDIVDRIAGVPTDNSDKPLTVVKILQMKVVPR